MKLNIVDDLILAIVGSLFVNASLSIYSTNWPGLIVGVLLMLPGFYTVLHDLWDNF